jgi:hypothetical protein
MPGELGLQPLGVVGVGEPGDPFGGGEQDPPEFPELLARQEPWNRSTTG